MFLSHRLQTIASLVENHSIVADIGTDHGLLPIYLRQIERASKAYAIDNKKGPLSVAVANINMSGVSNIHAIQSDGLENLPSDCDTIILAGLGGTTIKKILMTHMDKLEFIRCIIIQANVGIEKLRYWMSQNGYKIVAEQFVEENNLIYDIVKFEKGSQQLTPREILFGPLFLVSKNHLFYQKWRNTMMHYRSIYDTIPQQNARKKHYLDIIQTIEKEIEGS